MAEDAVEVQVEDVENKEIHEILPTPDERDLNDVNVEDSSQHALQFLGKDDVLQSKTDPFWSNTRNGLLILFWLAWISLLTYVVLQILTSKKII